MAMLHPSLDKLVGKVDSKYTLVVVAARRARSIIDGARPVTESKSNKPVTMALEEIMADKVRFERTEIGIK